MIVCVVIVVVIGILEVKVDEVEASYTCIAKP